MTNQITWAFSGRPATLEEVHHEVGAGWNMIVQELIAELFDLGWDSKLHQIKEKFGGLRFYIGVGSDAIHDAIQAAEDWSYRTCEVTGEPGELRDDLGWMRVLCDEEYAKAKEKKNVQS
jgi:hypothetical protein